MSDALDQSHEALGKAIAERERRDRIIKRILDNSFEKQRQAVNDESPFQAWLCTRRAGKTVAFAKKVLMDAQAWPGANYLYLSIDKKHALKVIWKDVFKKQCKEAGIPCRINESLGLVRFGNYCNLYIAGLDDIEEVEKVLGNKYRIVGIDEAASQTIDLQDFVYNKVLPAVTDLEGQIVLLGTPGRRVKTFFHKVTIGEVDGWSVRKWTAFDNPNVAKQWARQIAALQKKYPGIEKTPGFRNMYLGEWALDESDLVYKYRADRNLIQKLPEGGKWYYLLGIDLGYNPDPTAFVIAAYREYDPHLYFIHAYKRTGMNIGDVATMVKHYQTKFSFHRMIVDNANAQAVAEMRDRYQLALEAAEKAGKADFIAIMNADMEIGRIKALAEHCEPLTEEWESLTWDEKARLKGKWEEDPKAANHCSDGGLYVYRYAYNYVDRGAAPQINKSADVQMEEYWKRLAADSQREAEQDFWERAA